MEIDGAPHAAAATTTTEEDEEEVVPSGGAKAAKKTKRSRRVPRSAETVHEGIKEAIRSKGLEPTPTAYFGCLITLIAKPDPDTLLHLLTLLDVIVRQVPTNVALKCQRRVMQQLANVVHQYSRVPRVARKALRCLRSLFKVTEISEFHLTKMEAFQPSKFNVEVMVAYNQLMSSIFTGLHGCAKRPMCLAHLPTAIERWLTQFLEDTPEPVTRSGATEMRKVLLTCLSREVLEEHAAASEEQKPRTVLGQVLGLLVPALHKPIYKPNWDLIAICFGDIYRKLGTYAYPLLNDVLRTLDNLRLHGGWQYQSAAERAIGYAIAAIGAQNLFSVIPYDPTELEDRRAYLIPLIRRRLSHDSIDFFVTHLVPLADRCKEAALVAQRANSELAAKDWELRYERIYSLLPAFCKYPTDLAEGDNYMRLAKRMTDLLKESDTIVTNVTNSWTHLVQTNKGVAEGKRMPKPRPERKEGEGDDEEEDDANSEAAPQSNADTEGTEATTVTTAAESLVSFTDRSGASVSTIADGGERGGGPDALEFYHESLRDTRTISPEQAKANLAVLARYARIILPRLCNQTERVASKNVRGHILTAIAAYASIADPSVMDPLFTTLLNELRSDRRNVHKWSVMLSVGTTLVEHLSEERLQELFDTLPAMLAQHAWETELMVYKVLLKLCKSRVPFVQRNFEAYLQLLLLDPQRPQCAPVGTRLRLLTDSLELVWSLAPERYPAVASTHLPEFVHHVSNAKENLKEAAIYAIYMICFRAKERSGSVEPVVRVLLPVLQSGAPREVSSGIVSLGKIFYEHYGSMGRGLVHDILSSCIGLVRSDKVAVHDAVFAFLRLVLKAVSFDPELHDLFREEVLGLAVEGVLYWVNQKDLKRGLRVNMLVVLRMIMEKLIKRFGLDAVLALTPEGQRKWVRFVEKQRQTTEKRREKAREKHAKDSEAAKKELAKKFKLLYKGQGQEDRKVERKKRQFLAEAKRNAAVLMRTGEEVQDLSDPTIVSAFVANPERKGFLLGDAEEDDDHMVDIDTDGTIVVTSTRANAHSAPVQPKPKPGTATGAHRHHHQSIAESSGGLFSLGADEAPNSGGGGKQPKSMKDLRKRRRFEDDDDEDDEDGGGYDGTGQTGLERAVPMETPFVNVPNSQASKRVERIKSEMSQAKRRKFEKDYSAKVHTGSTFKGRKGAAGDIQKDTKEPYAYIPLNRALLNKRMKKVAHHQFDTVESDARIRQMPTRNKVSAVRKHSATIGQRKSETRESAAREKRLRSAKKSSSKKEKADSKLGGGVKIR
eukprot:TRINITY_DN1736_c0_g1_i1.p1 TRINITY_DN1736_c0_g1~~TRINITY_DN1736_c0_g1_i1.p1  ORF type:complete len:1285 (-),score=375.05 TRINITY_DN1736_c0_g1_i1:389-4243(-)